MAAVDGPRELYPILFDSHPGMEVVHTTEELKKVGCRTPVFLDFDPNFMFRSDETELLISLIAKANLVGMRFPEVARWDYSDLEQQMIDEGPSNPKEKPKLITMAMNLRVARIFHTITSSLVFLSLPRSSQVVTRWSTFFSMYLRALKFSEIENWEVELTLGDLAAKPRESIQTLLESPEMLENDFLETLRTMDSLRSLKITLNLEGLYHDPIEALRGLFVTLTQTKVEELHFEIVGLFGDPLRFECQKYIKNMLKLFVLKRTNIASVTINGRNILTEELEGRSLSESRPLPVEGGLEYRVRSDEVRAKCTTLLHAWEVAREGDLDVPLKKLSILQLPRMFEAISGAYSSSLREERTPLHELVWKLKAPLETRSGNPRIGEE